MNRARAAAPAPGKFTGAVRNDLIQIHMSLRARAGLPNRERKFFSMPPGNDFIGGALDQRQRANQLGRWFFGGNTEIPQRALRLRAPQARRGDGDFSKGIVLKTCGFHHSGSISSCVDAYFILTLYLILKNKGGDYDAVFLLPILKRSQSVCDDNSLRQLSRL